MPLNVNKHGASLNSSKNNLMLKKNSKSIVNANFLYS